MVLLIVAELMFFGALASTYVVLRSGAKVWRPPELPELVSPLSLSNCVVLATSALSMFLAARAARREDPVGTRFHLGFGTLFGSVFVGIQCFEMARLMRIVPMSGNLFGSVFHTYIALHAVHVLGGIVILFCVLWKSLRGKYHRYRHTGVLVAGYYWYFVVLVWGFLYVALYLY